MLRDSHILPEFVYRPTYDEDHSTFLYDTTEDRSSTRRRGFWDKLLCDECEARFGRLENYVASAWFRGKVRPSLINQKVVRIAGLDYCRFKLFHLSILWRAAVATVPAFRRIELGAHRERLRTRLLSAEPGPPDQYPIAGVAIRDPETGAFKDDLMHLPVPGRYKGHHLYRTLFGGVFWHIAVSSHTGDCPIPAALEETGTLTLAVEDWTKNAAVLEMAQQLQRHFGDN